MRIASRAKWQAVWRDSGLVRASIEEVLRYESPVSRQPRVVRADTEFRGQTLRQGQAVIQMLNAANRDPAVFADPERFDIRREDNRHIAFGHGIHFCVGALLARTEAHVALSKVLQRLPNIELTSATPDWDTDRRNGRSLRSLPVRF